jgi:peptidoglycan hydrolase CwlO-like protein
MTRFSYDKGHFDVGVQPNEVPQSYTIDSDQEKGLIELQEENSNLRNKIASLKATISKTQSVV